MEAPAQIKATELDCLKYIIETARTDATTTDIFKHARNKFIELGQYYPRSLSSWNAAAIYAKSLIEPLNTTIRRLRCRVQEIPEKFGDLKNARVRSFPLSDLGDGWEQEREFQTFLDQGDPYVMTTKLISLIAERKEKENVVDMLQTELRCRLDRAADQGWFPDEVRIDLNKASPERKGNIRRT